MIIKFSRKEADLSPQFVECHFLALALKAVDVYQEVQEAVLVLLIRHVACNPTKS